MTEAVVKEWSFAVRVFSGTGNTWRVSGWLRDALEAAGATCRRIVVDRQARVEHPPFGCLVVMTPTHGFTLPWLVMQDIARLPRGRGRPAYVLTTRACMTAGRVFVGGISGSALLLAAILLAARGYRVRGAASFDMPSNWFVAHPIQTPANQQRIVERARRRVATATAKVARLQPAFPVRNNLWELAWGILLAPVSLGYLVCGRFMLGKLFLANPRCDGCGRCARQCPVHAIRMQGEPARPFWTLSCESCMRCAAACPRDAIEAGHVWAVLLGLITGLPVGERLLAGLMSLDVMHNVSGAARGLAGFLLGYAWYLASLVLAYRVWHRLLRLPPVRRFFSAATLTRYWGRHFDAETRIDDLRGTPDR